MERITEGLESGSGEAERETQIKQQIFEKLSKRMTEMAVAGSPPSVCGELNPDVIVISGDQTVIIEPQNLHASKWLRQRFGFGSEEVCERERFSVHPCQFRKIADELKAAGFAVAC